MKDSIGGGGQAGCEWVDGGAARMREWGWDLECKTSFGDTELAVPWDGQVGMSCRQVQVSRMEIMIRKFQVEGWACVKCKGNPTFRGKVEEKGCPLRS